MTNSAMIQQRKIKIFVIIFSNFVVDDGSGHTPIVFESHLFSCMLYSFRLPNFFWIAVISSAIVFPQRSCRNDWMVYTWCTDDMRRSIRIPCYHNNTCWQRLIRMFTFQFVDNTDMCCTMCSRLIKIKLDVLVEKQKFIKKTFFLELKYDFKISCVFVNVNRAVNEK